MNSRLFKVLPLNNIYYQRDVRCRLRDRMRQCLLQTNRRSSEFCLSSSLGLQIDEPLVIGVTPPPSPLLTAPLDSSLSSSQFERIRADLTELAQQVEALKTRNRALGDLERALDRLNLTAHELKLNLSELFELYETEYDSNLRLQHHLNELFSRSSSASASSFWHNSTDANLTSIDHTHDHSTAQYCTVKSTLFISRLLNKYLFYSIVFFLQTVKTYTFITLFHLN